MKNMLLILLSCIALQSCFVNAKRDYNGYSKTLVFTKQLSEEEIREALKTIISELGATSPKDMGKVMQSAQKTFAGQADNKLVSQIVKELLG
jgi:Glu-tRNA(Gln) amidotransferase subunit E-like FAD-binding protein